MNKKRKYWFMSLLLFIMFISVEILVEYYWHASPFKHLFLFLVIFFILSLLININLDKIFINSKIFYILAKTFVFGSFGAVTGNVFGNLLLIPFLSIGGESKWLMLGSFWIFILFFVLGLTIGFGISLGKVIRGNF